MEDTTACSKARTASRSSVNGVWGIAFGNGGQAGPRNTLFAAAGPHLWRGASELQEFTV